MTAVRRRLRVCAVVWLSVQAASPERSGAIVAPAAGSTRAVWLRWSVVWACVLVMAHAAAGVSGAQAASSRVVGTILDESGSRLPGATVTVSYPDGTVIGTTRSAPDGSFSIAQVAPGRLVVVVQLDGFRTTRSTLDLAPSADARTDVVLPIAGFADSVSITASRSERTLAAVPSAVSVLAGPVVATARGVNLAEMLRFVPGVLAGDVSGVDDLRISIRGAGIRAGFGSRGVLLMADGFPVTEPDGQTPHLDGQIDLASAERVEVVKGPASAAYGGAALGGVVNVVSRVPSRSPTATLRAEGGSFAFGKVHGAGSLALGPFVVGGTLGYTHLDGFRDHNSLRNWAATARADRATAASRLTISVLGTDARLELPGTLNRQQFDEDPSQVRPIYVANDWGRDNRLVRAGAQYERQMGARGSLEVDSYVQVRDLFHPIFAVIDQDARRYVGHGRYRHTEGPHTLVAGVDADVQRVDDRWFVNAAGRPGFRIRDDDNTVTNAGLYVQDEIALGRATATIGVRADRITYDLDDGLTGAASDVQSFRRVSPKLGVTIGPRTGLVFYGNLATGFEAPTLGEVRLPAGFNADVLPQTAVSGELGVRGSAGRLSYDAAVYRMVVDDAILPETVENVTLYRNVARAGHTGVELSTRLRTSRWLLLDGTYAYSRFTLDDFGIFSRNRLPGVPPHLSTVRASIHGVRAWDASVALVAASSTFVSDANVERAPAYGVLSASAGYHVGRVRVFARGENLGDARYTNRVQVNDASGFFYYPAPGRHGSVGAEIRW